MKHLAPGLLLSYAVYSAFVPVSIAHSIILTSLAAVYAYEAYLRNVHSPKLEQKLSDMQAYLDQNLGQIKADQEERLKKIEAEQARQQFEKVNNVQSTKKSREVLF